MDAFTYDPRIDLDEYEQESHRNFEAAGRRFALRQHTEVMKALDPQYTHESLWESLERKRISR